MFNQPFGILDTASRWWPRIALAGVLLLAIFLHFFRLEQEGYGNLYYAATVKSMLTSGHNFFFASFDPGGFVAVDKPPLGLWVQALSALVCGFRGWSLLLPQALAGVLAVALLYHLVRRSLGQMAGLVAALVLTLTPISIAANRNNTMDSQLVLTSLLAAWAFIIATEKGRLRWLLLGAVLVGLGFNIKMLQAFLVLPALYLLYLLAAPLGLLKRLWHLAVATIVLGAVSLSWAVMVDLTPPEARPYVGSSTNNTELQLIMGHNAAARLGALGRFIGWPPGKPAANLPPSNAPLGSPGQPGPITPQPAPPQPAQPVQRETGEPGPWRLFNREVGGQATWLLPLALFSLVVLLVKFYGTRHTQYVVLWGMWLIPQIVFFSFAGLFHRYYLEMLSPAIAALVGAGFVTLWDDYARGHRRGWLLPLALLIGAGTVAYLLAAWPQWSRWLTPLVVGLCILAALGLIGLRLVGHTALSVRSHSRPQLASGGGSHAADPQACPDTSPSSSGGSHAAETQAWEPALLLGLQAASAIMGLLALLIAPAIWSAFPVWAGGDAALPYASPELLERRRPGNALPDVSRLAAYLTANRHGAEFLAATMDANTAAPLILATGAPVMSMGGFGGNDRILTTEALATIVATGRVRFFLVPAAAPAPPGGQNNPQPFQPGDKNALLRWIAARCASVPATVWRPGPGPNAPLLSGPSGPTQLYDCSR
jgi:4-amino-4-deoxy-L-arabinose transferase-like glycosyltransferase